MFRVSPTVLSWISFTAALVLWAGVGFFARATTQARVDYLEHVVNVEQASSQQTTALQLRTLARETREDRTDLENIVHKDIVEIITMVENVGEDIGVPVEISGALSGTDSNSALSAQTLGFTVTAQGTFSEVVHLAALLESMPIPSLVDQMRFESVSSDTTTAGSDAWHTVLEMRFFTTVALSQ